MRYTIYSENVEGLHGLGIFEAKRVTVQWLHKH